MKTLRDWATPITIGAFAIMSVTGVLMFFHLDSGFNKLAHEWLSWLMVGGVLLHAYVNWPSFKRYFVSSALGRAIIAVSVLMLAGSFTPNAGGGGSPPPVLAMKAVTSAPLTALAPLTGKPVADLIADLGKAGITLPSAEASIDSVTGGNRELQGKAMAVLFRKG